MNQNSKLTALILAALLILFAAAMSGQETVGHAQLDTLPKKPISESAEWLADAKRQLGLNNNVYVLSSASEELTGDSAIDNVLLVGVKSSNEDPFAENIDILLRDGKSGRFSAAGLRNLSSAQAALFFGDYNGNKTKDVLVAAPTQDGGLNHAIASFPNGQAVILFSGRDSAYRFISKQMKTQHADVAYPQIEGLSDTAAREFANQALEAAASELVSRAAAPISIDYSIARGDSAMVSVVFSSEQADGSQPILATVTINLRTRKLVTLDNIAIDRQSRQGIEALIQSAAKQANLTAPQELNEWTGIYFSEQDAVLYYKTKDGEYKRLYLPLEKLRPILAKSAR